MQDFFRDWHEADPEVNASACFVDQSKIDVMTRLNAELIESLDGDDLKMRFFKNVELIRNLRDEIQDRVKSSQPTLKENWPQHGADSFSTQLDSVFEMLNI